MGMWDLKEVAKNDGLSIWLPKDQYKPGEPIVGKLKANLTKRITIRGVRIKLNGLVHIHWHTGSGKDRRDYSKSAELLTERVFTLHGYEKGASGPDLHLEANQSYEWDFTFHLPPDLPGSVTLRDGTYIRYILNGFADIPNWPDYEVTYAPDVEPSPAAFAASAEMCEPFDRTDMTPVYSCCCCCPRGHAAITMRLPQRTIVMEPKNATVNVPQLTVAVDNASKSAVKAMTVWIIGHVWMTNGSSTHGYSFTVTQFDLAQALGPSEKMQPRAIPLPPLEVKRSVHLDERAKLTLQQPSLPDVKGILRLTYSLVVTADVGVCVAEPRMEVPLLITWTPGASGAVVDAPPAEEQPFSLPASFLRQQEQDQPFALPASLLKQQEELYGGGTSGYSSSSTPGVSGYSSSSTPGVSGYGAAPTPGVSGYGSASTAGTSGYSSAPVAGPSLGSGGYSVYPSPSYS